MTEGIIQKIFTQYPSKTLFKQIDDNFNRDYSNMIMDYVTQDIIRIRQELIEEIKKLQHTPSYSRQGLVLLTDIIGDSD